MRVFGISGIQSSDSVMVCVQSKAGFSRWRSGRIVCKGRTLYRHLLGVYMLSRGQVSLM